MFDAPSGIDFRPVESSTVPFVTEHLCGTAFHLKEADFPDFSGSLGVKAAFLDGDRDSELDGDALGDGLTDYSASDPNRFFGSWLITWSNWHRLGSLNQCGYFVRLLYGGVQLCEVPSASDG